jgi:hypothetical protein
MGMRTQDRSAVASFSVVDSRQELILDTILVLLPTERSGESPRRLARSQPQLGQIGGGHGQKGRRGEGLARNGECRSGYKTMQESTDTRRHGDPPLSLVF